MSAFEKYPTGSFRQLVTLSTPMMLAALSGNLMLFVDRLFLANYSTAAMNGAAAAGLMMFTFAFPGMSIAVIAEVFVGQFNGSKKYDQISKAVWQMILFALALSVIFIPVSFFGGQFLMPDSLEKEAVPYFRWVMFFGWISPLIAAISSFFIGRGVAKTVTISAIAGNLTNFGLDYVLIFGVNGVIPAMGTEGAGIATAASLIIQVSILVFVFLNKVNRKEFNTHKCVFEKELFFKCFKVGGPSAIGHFVEISAWSFLFHITASVSIVHVTVNTMGQNILILFSFMTDGMQKGIISVASNIIGSSQWEKIKTLMLSAMKFMVLIACVLAVPIIGYPELLIDLFEIDEAAQFMGNVIIHQTVIAFIFVWLYILVDGMVWFTAGVLTAAGDTKYIMWVNSFGAWVFGVLPIYYFVTLKGGDAYLIWALVAFYGFMNLILMLARYQWGNWRKLDLSK